MDTDWRLASHYQALAHVERKALAWEWLRRTDDYLQAWTRHGSSGSGRGYAHRFGLEQFEDPTIAAPDAKPVWTAQIDPAVIPAIVVAADPNIDHHIDLLLCRHLIRIAIDASHDEHVLLSDGRRSIRLDIVGGTLLGCPARLSFLLDTKDRMRSQLRALEDLRKMAVTGTLGGSSPPTPVRERWITELRVADALRSQASHFDIARCLFGSMVSERRWRSASAPYRMRVQRITRQVRKRLLYPLDRTWFA